MMPWGEREGMLFRKPVATPDRVRGRLVRDHALSRESRDQNLVSRSAGFDLRDSSIDLPDYVPRERAEMEIEGHENDDEAQRARIDRGAVAQGLPEDVARLRQAGHDPLHHFGVAKLLLRLAGSQLLLAV